MGPAELVTLIAAVTASIVSLIGALVAAYNAVQGARTHKLVNGQSQALQKMSEDKGFAEGAASTAADHSSSESSSSSSS